MLVLAYRGRSLNKRKIHDGLNNSVCVSSQGRQPRLISGADGGDPYPQTLVTKPGTSRLDKGLGDGHPS